MINGCKDTGGVKKVLTCYNEGYLFKSKKSIILILMFILSTCVTWGAKVFFDIGRVLNYVSPFILLNGLLLVVLFSRLNIKWKGITKVSVLAFGIYLFQLNPVIWDNVIQDGFIFVTTKEIYIAVLYVFLIAFIIFACGLVVEWVRQKIEKIIKIPELSKKIVNICDKGLEKLFVLLK